MDGCEMDMMHGHRIDRTKEMSDAEHRVCWAACIGLTSGLPLLILVRF